MYSKHKCQRLYGKDAVSNMTRTGQSVRSKYSTTPYCITKYTQPAGAAEYGSSSLTGNTAVLSDSGGT
jgi:hypothetical protein